MKALILDNRVVDVSIQEFPVAKPLIWMDCPDECEAGWELVDGRLKPKLNPPLTDQQIKNTRIDELRQLLRDTDYVALSDYDQDKPELIAQRIEWRNEIRELEND